MRCETVREALSARIDGEPEPIRAAVVDRHVVGCAGCRDWYRRAEELRRATILHPAPAVPDLTARIMAAVPEQTREPVGLRAALAVVAVAQTSLALAQLFGADTGMGHAAHGAFMMGHMSHESAAWNLAIGIGLVWAALRTRTAAGQLPMLSVFVGVLTGVSLLDITRGDVTAARLISHVPVLLGVALLYLVYRRHRDDDRPIGDRMDTGRERFADEVPDIDVAHEDSILRFRHRRPASRHRAA